MIQLLAYVASPIIFSPDAEGLYQGLRDRLEERWNIKLLTPADSYYPTAEEIFKANLRLIDQSDIVLVDCTPFRGPSADVGTAVELGYAYAKGKPCIGFHKPSTSYAQRVKIGNELVMTDERGWLIENFNLFDNLMIAQALTPQHEVEDVLMQLRTSKSAT